jgi:hypothetical protein
VVDWETLAEAEKLTHIRINRERASMYYSLGEKDLILRASGICRVTELYRNLISLNGSWRSINSQRK